MKSLWTLFALLIALSMQAQPYTVTEDGCRMFATDGSLDQSFLIDRLMWVDRGSNSDQIMIFDGISALVVQDADLANYPTTDSLIEQMKVWIVECDTAGTAPGPVPLTALFANQKSIDLDGTAEYVTVADDISLTMADGSGDLPFTMAAWVNMVDASNAIIGGKADGVNFEYSFATKATDELNLTLFDANAGNSISASTNSTLTTYQNQWIHVAATYDGNGLNTGITLYVNGVAQAVTTGSAGSYVSMENTTAGYNAGFNGLNYSNMKMDQSCIWKGEELTLPEIKELMTIRDVTQFTYYDSLVIYHEYDNPDSTQTDGIVDLGPAGNHGTMQSGEYTDLNLCVTWPYSYQLDSNTSYSNLTPMQSSVESDSSFGGFFWAFDGADNRITIDDNNLLTFGTNPFSISGWIYMEDATNFYIATKELAVASPREFQFNVDGSDKLAIALFDNSTSDYISINSTAAITQWEGQYIHVVAVCRGGTSTDSLELWLNGIEITSVTATSVGSYSGLQNTAAKYVIGDTESGTLPADGIMQSVEIFDKALSQTEISLLYGEHQPPNALATSLAGNLVTSHRAYNSDVGSGVAVDQSANSLNGTLVNFTTNTSIQYGNPREIYDSDTAGSVDFDGLSDYISIADSDSLSFTDGAGTDEVFSLNLWANADDWTSARLINKYEHSNTVYEWALFTNASDKLIFQLESNTTTDVIQVTTDDALTGYQGQWINIHADNNGGELAANLTLFINGEIVAQTTSSAGSYTGMSNTTAGVAIGRLDGQAGFTYFDGKISHVTILNDELTRCQVQELYNDGSPIDPRDATFWNDNFIHYKLDQSEDLETTEGVTNISPNGSCNGTATNMTNAANKITTSFPTN